MIGSLCNLRTTRTAMLASILFLVDLGPAAAVPPTLNSSGLSPQQCYRRDSDCTQFCGAVTGDLRYECFGICDRMLDRCLETGEWSDSLTADPGTGNPPSKGNLTAGLFMRMLMIMSDSDGDGTLSSKEIQAVKDSVFGPFEAGGAPKAPVAPSGQ